MKQNVLVFFFVALLSAKTGGQNVPRPLSNQKSLRFAANATNAVPAVDPASGPPGSVLFLSGAGFSPAIVSNKVTFNDLSAAIVSATASKLGVVVPGNSPVGDATVAVIANGTTNPPLKFLVTAPNRIALSVARSDSEAVVSWPAAFADAHLESTGDLAPPIHWGPATNATSIVVGRKQIKLTPGGALRFFRLRDASVPGDLSSGGASTGHGTVSASNGGSVSTDDRSATLVIPPAALAQDTDIQITSAHIPGIDDASTSGDVLLSPEGLTFSKPVTLKLQLPGNPPDGYELGVELLSRENTQINVGGEISYFQSVTNYVFDPATSQLEIPLSHFSSAGWFLAKKLYAVLNIPGKYLKKGDLIYVLTGADGGQGGTWYPGHVGLYLGAQSAFADANDGDTIIEATQTQGLSGQVRFDSLNRGLTAFESLNQTHIYLGARRPLNFDPTDNDRTEAADWAIGKLGQPYTLIGGGAFFADDAPLRDGFTCVGLTEQAYELGVGKRIVPWQAARIVFTPFRQFQWTRPVDTVQVEVGDDFSANIVGLVDQGHVRAKYYSDDQLYTRSLDIDSCSIEARDAITAKRANFEPVFGLFSFKPATNDAGKNLRFAFKIDATKSDAGIENAALTVKVNGSVGPHLTREQQTFTGFTGGLLSFTPVGSDGQPPVLTVRGELASALTAPGARITATNASITITPNGGTPEVLNISWPEPPATLETNATFNFPLTAQISGSNLGYDLRGQAFAHYQSLANATSFGTATTSGQRATATFGAGGQPAPVSTAFTFSATNITASAGTLYLKEFDVVLSGSSLFGEQVVIHWFYTEPSP